jgi:alpha-soluble NSF attachment protein
MSSSIYFLFPKNVLDACEQEDVDAFTEHVTKFDQLTTLDPWKTTLLLRTKKLLQEEPSLT